MRRSFWLAFSLVFILLLGGLLSYYIRLSPELERQTAEESLRERGKNHLESLKYRASPLNQMANLLSGYARTAGKMAGVEAGDTSFSPRQIQELERIFRKEVFPFLPEHQIVVWSCASGAEREIAMFSRGRALSFGSRGLLAGFLSGRKKDGNALVQLAKALEGFLRFPISEQFIGENMPNWRARIQVFSGIHGSLGFFWDSVKVKGGGQVLVFGFMDMTRLHPLTGYRILVTHGLEKGQAAEVGVGFIPWGKGKPLWSSLFLTDPALRKAFLGAREHFSKGVEGERFGDFLLFSAPPSFGESFFPILALRLNPPGSGKSADSLPLILLGCVISLMTWFVVEKIWFGRAMTVRIGPLMVGAFGLMVLLPLSGTMSVFVGAQAENERTTRFRLVEGLHEKLQHIDNGALFKQAEMVAGIRKSARGNDWGRLLSADLASGTDRALSIIASSALPGSEFPSGIPTGTSTGFLTGFPAGKPARSCLNSVGVSGPDEFYRSWPQRPRGKEYSFELDRLFGRGDTLVRLFSHLNRGLIRKINDRFGKVGRGGVGTSHPAVGMLLESAYFAIMSVSGPEILYRVIHFPMEVASLRTQWDMIHMMHVPIFEGGSLKFLMGWMWGDLWIGLPYLRDRFEIEKGKDPDCSLAAVVQSRRQRGMNVPQDPDLPPMLKDLVETSDITLMTLRGEESLSERICEAKPGRLLSTYVLAGSRSTSEVRRLSEAQNNAFRLYLAIFILVATLVGFLGASYLLQPLGEISNAIAAVDRQDYTVRLDTSRPDEFGSLGSAFNVLVKGLQEGVLLEKFVSSLVRRVIRDENLRASAAKGEVREVTVLFSSLPNFEDFQKNAGRKEVLGSLQAHFELITKAVEKFGGEIDKVMGERILVLFFHDDFRGGDRTAVSAAFAVAYELLEAFQRLGRESPSIGITTGSTISGILGAPSVRLDYTVIGDTVNLASRLSMLAHTTGGSRIVMSERVRELAGDKIGAQRLPFKRVKGKTQEVEAYLLV